MTATAEMIQVDADANAAGQRKPYHRACGASVLRPAGWPIRDGS